MNVVVTHYLDGLPFDIYTDADGKIWVSKIGLVRIYYGRKDVDSSKVRDIISRATAKYEVEYNEIVVDVKLGRQTYFVDPPTAIAFLAHTSERNGKDALTSPLQFLLSFTSSPVDALSSSANSNRLKSTVTSLFLKLESREQIEILTHLRKHGNEDVRKHLNGKSKRGSYTRTPKTENIDRNKKRKSNKLSSNLMKSIKKSVLGNAHPAVHTSPLKNESYKASPDLNTIQNLLLKYKFDDRLIEALVDLVDNNRMIFKATLTQPHFRDLILSIFLNDVDTNINELFTKSFTIIKTLGHISQAQWDKYIKPSLKFLETIFSPIDVVFGGKYYTNYYHSLVKHLIVHETVSGDKIGSSLDLIQILVGDLQNSNIRPHIQFYQTKGESPILFLPTLYSGDAYTFKTRLHLKQSALHFCSVIQQLTQNPTFMRTLVLAFATDDHLDQSIFFSDLYEDIHWISSNFVDPLSNNRIFMLPCVVGDSPYLEGITGGASCMSTYGNFLADGVSQEDIIDIKNRPLLCRWPQNRDSGLSQKRNEEILKIANQDNQTERQRASRILKTCIKNPNLGSCYLFLNNVMHLDFKPCAQFVKYTTMLFNIVDPSNVSFGDLRVEIGDECNIKTIFLMAPNIGSKPKVNLRGEDIPKLVNGPQYRLIIIRRLGNSDEISPLQLTCILDMLKSLRIFCILCRETTKLTYQEAVENSRIIDHELTNFYEYGSILFERKFINVSATYLLSQFPSWYVATHTVGHGMWHRSEGVSENKHKDDAKARDLCPVATTKKMSPCTPTTSAVKHLEFQHICACSHEEIINSKIQEFENKLKTPVDIKALFYTNSEDQTDPSVDVDVIEGMDNAMNISDVDDSDEESEESENQLFQDFAGGDGYFEIKDLTNNAYVVCPSMLYQPMKNGFSFPRIRIPHKSRNVLVFKLNDEEEVEWQLHFEWLRIRQIKMGGMQLNLPRELMEYNSRRPVNKLKIKDKDFVFLAIDLLEKPIVKSRPKDLSDVDPTGGLLDSAQLLIFEIGVEESKILETHINLKCVEAQNLRIFNLDSNLVGIHDSTRFNMRGAMKNREKLCLLGMSDKVDADLSYYRSKYKNYGSHPGWNCPYPECGEKNIKDTFAHGACRAYVDREDIRCSNPAHDLWWDIISGNVEPCEDPISPASPFCENVYSAQTIYYTKDFLTSLSTYDQGISLTVFKQWLYSMNIDHLEFILSLSTRILLSQSLCRIYHYRLRFSFIVKNDKSITRERGKIIELLQSSQV